MEKYTLNLDNDNFVLSIAHTKNDNVELDLSQYDLEYLNAYQFLNSGLVLNEEKKAEIIAQREEEAKKPTEAQKLEAQLLYTAVCTDTLLESEVE